MRDTVKSELDELNQEVTAKGAAQESLETRKTKLSDRLKSLTTTKAEAVSKASDLSTEIGSAETEINQHKSTAENISVKLKEAKADRHESSRVRKLDEAIATMKERIPGVHGKLIDLCKPTQVTSQLPLSHRTHLTHLRIRYLLPSCSVIQSGRLLTIFWHTFQEKYNTAVAVVMGKNMDSVVVDNAEVGQKCITYLKDNRIPPATFIPLSSIKVTC
jgi:structural maintenance of chromosome 1